MRDRSPPPPEVRDIHTVLCRPSNFAAAERGGSKLHAAFCQDEELRQLHATGEFPVFVAVDTGNRKMWYGQLILCFVAQYMSPVELCYVRWLDSLPDLAAQRVRELTPLEKAGPFETFRWSTRPGSLRSGHPRANAPHYGVVRADAVRYRAAIIPSIADDLSAENPLFRLNTDMYLL